MAFWQVGEKKLCYNGLSFYKPVLLEYLHGGHSGKGGEHVLLQNQKRVVVRMENVDNTGVFLWAEPWPAQETPVLSRVELTRIKRQLQHYLHTASLFSSFMTQFPLGLLVASLEEGQVLDWNPRLDAITGWLRSEVLGKRLAEIFLFSAEEMEEVRQNLLFGETLFLRNVRIVNRFSEERLLNFHFFPWKPEKMIFMMAIVEDVTERARWGESVRQMEKLSSIGRFISSVAHEINNPLAVIYGYTQMLLPRLEKGNVSCETCKATRKVLE